MSRAFVKEQDGEDVAEDLPERIHSDAPNYITVAGEKRLRLKLHHLREEYEDLSKENERLGKTGDLQRLDRDINYIQERLHRAIPVDRAPAPYDCVRFGMSLSLRDASGNDYEFTIVGEDEIDLDVGKISWTSALARILIQKKIDDVVIWKHPAGELELNVCEIKYKAEND